MRSRVKEARPLYSVSTTKRDREMNKTTIGSFVRGKLCEPSHLDPFGGMCYHSLKMRGTSMKNLKVALAAACAVVVGGMLAAKAATVMSASAEVTLPVSAYVQRGLITHWDARNNSGTGVHVPDAPVWKDLKGSLDLELTANGSWSADGRSLVVKAKGCAAKATAPTTAYKSIEIVYKMSALSGHVIFASGCSKSRFVLGYWNDAGTRIYISADGSNQSTKYVARAKDAQIKSFSAFYDDSGVVADIASDGVIVQSAPTRSSNFGLGAGVAMIGDNVVTTAGNGWYGEVSSIRLYDHVLTPVELAQNAAVDKIRYWDADSAGYRFAAETGRLEVWLSLSSTDGGRFSVDGGSPVTCYEAWVPFGTNVSIAATPVVAGVAFAGWDGSVEPVLDTATGTYTLQVLGPTTMCARFSAGEKTWVGADGETDWFTASNWSPNGVPDDYEEVSIPAGATVAVPETTAALASLEVAGTLVSANWTTCVKAEKFVVAGGGTVTCEGPFGNDDVSNRVWIATKNLLVAKNGSIDVSYKGYRGATVEEVGQGPGGSPEAGHYDGPSHGGHGGKHSDDTWRLYRQPDPYDDYKAPLIPGSGGNAQSKSGSGGAGGGAIRIDATGGSVVIDGNLTANGYSMPSSGSVNGAGGAGGSIYVTCKTIAGAGTVSAVGGGMKGNGGAGGGGCIALVYDKTAQTKVVTPSLMISAAGGEMGYGRRSFETSCRQAEIGTVYMPDAALIVDPINVYGQIYLDEPKLSVDRLTVVSKWVAFPQEGFELDVAGDVVVKSKDNLNAGRLDIGGSQLVQFPCIPNQSFNGFRRYPMQKGSKFHVGGDLKIGDGTKYCDVVFPAARLTAADADGETPCGGTLRVDGTIEISSTCNLTPLSHLVTGVSPLVSCRNFIVKSGGTVNADKCGYIGGYNGGQGAFPVEEGHTLSGYGPGARQVTTAVYYSYGASHGGLAEGVTDEKYLYGDKKNPHMAGTGASGSTDTYGQVGCFGGGVIYVNVDRNAEIAGTLTVCGARLGGNHSGGSSGGSICLKAKRLKIDSTAVFSAKGGAKANSGKAGGGGRIAVWRQRDAPETVVRTLDELKAVASAAGGNASAGEGSVCLGTLPSPGLVILLR